MGLTKQYLRYVPSAVFGVVGSNKSALEIVEVDERNTFCAVGACEHVIIWNLKQGEKHLSLTGDKYEVTSLATNPKCLQVAVGYEDGSIKVFEIITGEIIITFNGHKKAVTCLSYDQDGVRLVSGSKDTDIIVWDIVSESGLYRLRGHKGVVTQVSFIKNNNWLVSSSKDTFIKFWDMDTQHCFKTLVGHRTEIWTFVLTSGDQYLISGSGDSELRVWRLSYGDEGEPQQKKMTENDDDSSGLRCEKLGSIMRQSRHRVVNMKINGSMLICHGSDSNIEVFKVNSEDELKLKLNKKEKKARKRARESGETQAVSMTLEDRIQKLTTLKMSGKLHSSQLTVKENLVTIVSLLTNNTIQHCTFNQKHRNPEASNSSCLSLPGHRTDVRTVCFSSDNTAILTASSETTKIWNRSSQQCIRTMSCDYALSSLFAPGDRHAIIGTKTGKIQIFDIASGMCTEIVDAHSGAVWSLNMAPDKRSIVSGSADHEVKFWNFELNHSSQLNLVHTRTLKMDEDVLCVKFSPDQRLLAVSLLDNTVKVFFIDTLKFFLSLYGHKLPVLCMDISSDSTILVTGSADRNIKIWGLDFGDCHKSIFAHDDSVMCLQFVPKTHLFFTSGKDRKVKQWDADNFEHIVTLDGHHAEIWCLAVSTSGNHVITSSHDKSLRLWEKTQEPLILEEEREMEREAEFEGNVASEPVVAGETAGEVGLAGKQTGDTLKAAERIMEALEICREETSKLKQHVVESRGFSKAVPPPSQHPMLMAYSVSSPDRYVLEVIKKVKSSELEQSLLVLPFPYITDLLHLLNLFIESGWEMELSCRCLLFILRVHQGQITSNQILLPILDKLRNSTSPRVTDIRDTIGFNMAGLMFLRQQLEQKREVTFFSDATSRLKTKRKKEKKAAILAIKT